VREKSNPYRACERDELIAFDCVQQLEELLSDCDRVTQFASVEFLDA
jgi:hypothetical protein